MKVRPPSLALLAGALFLALGACADPFTPAPDSSDPPGVTPPNPPPPAPPTPPVPVSANPRIYVIGTDGSAARQLAVGGWPAWSPDGQRLAFHRAGQIYVINADGSQEIRLADGSHPAWSPDGKRIACTHASGIAVMNADGSAIKTLLPHSFSETYSPEDMGVTKPSWSTDGRIAFEHIGNENQPVQIYVMNSDGTGARRLSSHPRGDVYAESDPAWSPDGKRITFWSYGYGIAVVDANGGTTTSIYQNFPTVAYGAKPGWSRDGQTVIFGAHYYAGAPQIWIVNADGDGRRVLIANGYDGAWSPDNTSIAFVRN
jgi:TolB protein